MSNAISSVSPVLESPAAPGAHEENAEPKAKKSPLESPLAKRMEVVPLAQEGVCSFQRDVTKLIFRRLLPHELLKVGEVCRLWYQLASSDDLWMSYRLQELFPLATFIDRNIWETYIDVEKYGWEMKDPGRPYVDKWGYIMLRRIESAVEGGLGFTVLWLFKGHKLNDTIDFAGSAKQGNSTEFGFIWPCIVEELGEKEVKEPVILAVTNNVFKKSRNKTIEEQQERVEELRCKILGILPAMDVVLMRYRISDPADPIRLFGDDPLTYTRLKKKVAEHTVVFGGFSLAPGGSDAFSPFSDREEDGVAGQWKFKVIKTDIKK